MAKSVLRRIQRLEDRVGVSQEADDHSALYVDPAQLEAAKSVLKNASVTQQRRAPKKHAKRLRLQPSPPLARLDDTDDELSDASRLRRLRELARAHERRDRLIW